MQFSQFHGANGDCRVDGQEMQTAQRLAPGDPFAHRQAQLESAALNEKRDLPCANCRNPQPTFSKRRLHVSARSVR